MSMLSSIAHPTTVIPTAPGYELLSLECAVASANVISSTATDASSIRRYGPIGACRLLLALCAVTRVLNIVGVENLMEAIKA